MVTLIVWSVGQTPNAFQLARYVCYIEQNMTASNNFTAYIVHNMASTKCKVYLKYKY